MEITANERSKFSQCLNCLYQFVDGHKDHQIETVLILQSSLSSDANELFSEFKAHGSTWAVIHSVSSSRQKYHKQLSNDPATRSRSHRGDRVQKSVTTNIVFESQIQLIKTNRSFSVCIAQPLIVLKKSTSFAYYSIRVVQIVIQSNPGVMGVRGLQTYG